MITNDPTWSKICLLDEEKKCASDNLPGGTSSKGSFLDILKYVYGKEASEST